MKVFIEGVGLIAPGMSSWDAGSAVLRGDASYEPSPLPKLPASQLPPAERRRATTVTRLAVEVAAQAISEVYQAAELATLFASSGGEVEVIDRIFTELATAERQISPTVFHNSVHNAASGYWSIATGSRQASMSLSAFDDTFGAALLEAAIQASVERLPVLLVCYDFPPLDPIFCHRPLTSPFAVSLLLSPQTRMAEPIELEITWGAKEENATLMADPALEGLRAGNPAGRCLPLLETLAKRQPCNLCIELSGDRALLLGLQFR